MTTDHPFAVWTVFRDAPRWWFARGCPPTVRDERRWVRFLRVSVLTGALGFGAAVLDLIQTYRLAEFDFSSNWIDWNTGALLGILVILPLSRWIGRSWWLAAIATLCSITCYRVSISLVELMGQLMDSWGVQSQFQSLVIMMMLGLALALPMISASRRRTWLIPPAIVLASVLAAVAEHVNVWMFLRAWPSIPNVPLYLYLYDKPPWVLFITLTTVALGMRLWWDEPPPQATVPCPAANTADTSTENPRSSTDVAVSPDLNSP